MAAPPPADGLAGFPILQWALAAGAFLGSVIAIVFGVRSKAAPPDQPQGQAQGQQSAGRGIEWFFDGPIAKVLDLLAAIYRELRQIREDQQRQANENNEKLDTAAELARKTNDLLAQIKERVTSSVPRRRI